MLLHLVKTTTATLILTDSLPWTEGGSWGNSPQGWADNKPLKEAR